MIGDLLGVLSKRGVDSTTIRQACAADPLGMEIEWTPLVSGGTNFKTHGHAEVNPDRFEFRATWGAKIFAGLLALVGACLLTGGLLPLVVSAPVDDGESSPIIVVFIMIGAGLTLMLLGFWMYKVFTQHIVFDWRSGYFWKGGRDPSKVMHLRPDAGYVRLESIYALQLLAEHCSGNKSSYFSCELNLVLQDGSRVNVIDHGNQEAIRQSANLLGEFLHRPVWDAT